MKNVMLDLETMDLKNTAAIISIGAVFFEMNGILGDKFNLNVDLDSCTSLGLTVGMDVVDWWENPKNKEAYLATKMRTVSLHQALGDLRSFLLRYDNPEEIYLWANSPAFDLVILKNAYEAAKISLPWKFYNEMDYRTMKNLFKVPKPEFEGNQHVAIDDAVFQVRHLSLIYISLQTAARPGATP